MAFKKGRQGQTRQQTVLHRGALQRVQAGSFIHGKFFVQVLAPEGVQYTAGGDNPQPFEHGPRRGQGQGWPACGP